MFEGVAPVTIGNNVLIDMDAYIMKGIEIGDIEIIGAGSIVMKNCESNSVYACNPARKTWRWNSSIIKKKSRNKEEAATMAKSVKDATVSEQYDALREYCCLFSALDDEQIC